MKSRRNTWLCRGQIPMPSIKTDSVCSGPASLYLSQDPETEWGAARPHTGPAPPVQPRPRPGPPPHARRTASWSPAPTLAAPPNTYGLGEGLLQGLTPPRLLLQSPGALLGPQHLAEHLVQRKLFWSAISFPAAAAAPAGSLDWLLTFFHFLSSESLKCLIREHPQLVTS